jgi:hypothetical protein
VISHSFHPEADAELEDASLFYESRMAGLGKSFAAEVERTISLIRQFPMRGRPSGLRVDASLSPAFRTPWSTGAIPIPSSFSQ